MAGTRWIISFFPHTTNKLLLLLGRGGYYNRHDFACLNCGYIGHYLGKKELARMKEKLVKAKK
jgi:hypothetical protein